jgi:hypothetical protein
LSDQQKAGIAMFEYNSGAGSSWLTSSKYPKLRNALQSGNIRAAAQELQRGGPNASRIKREKELFSSGPQQLVGPKIVGDKIVGDKIVGPGQVGGKGLLPSATDDQGLSRFIPKPLREGIKNLFGGNGPMINVVPVPLSPGGVNRYSSAASAAQSPIPDFSATSGTVEIALTKAILNATS